MSKLNLDSVESERRAAEFKFIKSLLDSNVSRESMLQTLRKRRAGNWKSAFGNMSKARFAVTPTIQWEEILETKRKFAIDRTQTIASGGLSEVYGGRILDDGSEYTNRIKDKSIVVKIIPKNMWQQSYLIRDTDRHLKLLLQLNHPHLIRVHMVYEVVNTQKIYLFMQRAKMGSLQQVVRDMGNISEDLSKKWTRDLLYGLDYLHDLGIGHRRVTPRHVLLMSPDMPAKLSAPDAFADIADPSTNTLTDATGIGYGDKEFVAPEGIFGQVFDVFALDVWGIGCTAYFMITTRSPFVQVTNRDSFKQQLDKKTWTQAGIIDNCPKIGIPAQNFVHSCLRGTISKRLTIPELLKTQWITSLNK